MNLFAKPHPPAELFQFLRFSHGDETLRELNPKAQPLLSEQ